MNTLHFGVALNMTKVRECRRVPRLIEVTKQVIGSCAGLKKGITCRGRSRKMNSDVGKTFIGTEKWLIKLFVMRKSKTTSSGRDEEKPLQKWRWRSSIMMIETANAKLGLSNIISSEKKNGVKEFSICEQERQHSERAVQKLYTLELTCDREVDDVSASLHPNASLFWPRRKG